MPVYPAGYATGGRCALALVILLCLVLLIAVIADTPPPAAVTFAMFVACAVQTLAASLQGHALGLTIPAALGRSGMLPQCAGIVLRAGLLALLLYAGAIAVFPAALAWFASLPAGLLLLCTLAWPALAAANRLWTPQRLLNAMRLA